METGVDPVEKLVLPVHEIVSSFGILVAVHTNLPLLAFFWDGVAVLILVVIFFLVFTLTLTLVIIFMLVLTVTLILVLIFGVVG